MLKKHLTSSTNSDQSIEGTNSANSTRWWLASVLLFLGFIILDGLLIDSEIKKSENEAALQKIDKPQNRQNNSMQLVSIALPPLPNLKKHEQINRELLREESSSQIQQGVVFPESQTSSGNTAKDATKITDNDLLQTKYLSEIMNMDGQYFQVDMPVSSNMRKRVGEFLYECVGIQLATIETRNKQKGLVYLSKPITNSSKILRQIKGELFANERNLISLYGSGEQLARVYPSWIDGRLSKHIGQNLQGHSLTQFSGRYALHNHLLQLVDIQVNGQRLQQVWTLASGFEQGC